MKTKEELSALKAEVTALSEKLRALTNEELEQVTGGSYRPQFYFRTTDVSGVITLPEGEAE